MDSDRTSATADRIMRLTARNPGESPVSTLARALIDPLGNAVLVVGLDGSVYSPISGTQIIDARGQPVFLSKAGPLLTAAQQLSSLSDDRLTQLTNLLNLVTTMANPILITQFRAADGTLQTGEITLGLGMMLTTDPVTGALSQQPIPVVPAERVGDIPVPASNIVGATGSVAFSSAMPSADYVLEVFNNGFAGALSTTKTANGFTYKILSILGGPFSFHAMQKV